MSKLLHHRTNGTYYTKRYEGGFVTRVIHPDGVAFLKNRGVGIGDPIPPYAISELVARQWLVTREEAARLDNVEWSPEWDAIAVTPSHDQHRRWQAVRSGSGAVAAPVRVPGAVTATPVAFTDFTLPVWGIVAIVVTMVLLVALGVTVFS